MTLPTDGLSNRRCFKKLRFEDSESTGPCDLRPRSATDLGMTRVSNLVHPHRPAFVPSGKAADRALADMLEQNRCSTSVRPGQCALANMLERNRSTPSLPSEHAVAMLGTASSVPVQQMLFKSTPSLRLPAGHALARSSSAPSLPRGAPSIFEAVHHATRGIQQHW